MVRRRKNDAERTFEERAISEGWRVTKKGWPDFLCRKDGRVIAVEVKRLSPKTGRRQALRREQLHTLEWLQGLGAEVYVSIADELIPFNRRQEWQHYKNRNYRKRQPDST